MDAADDDGLLWLLVMFVGAVVREGKQPNSKVSPVPVLRVKSSLGSTLISGLPRCGGTGASCMKYCVEDLVRPTQEFVVCTLFVLPDIPIPALSLAQQLGPIWLCGA